MLARERIFGRWPAAVGSARAWFIFRTEVVRPVSGEMAAHNIGMQDLEGSAVVKEDEAWWLALRLSDAYLAEVALQRNVNTSVACVDQNSPETVSIAAPPAILAQCGRGSRLPVSRPHHQDAISLSDSPCMGRGSTGGLSARGRGR